MQLRLEGFSGLGAAGKQDMGDIVFGAMDDTKVKGTLASMIKNKKIQIVDAKTGQAKYEKEIQEEIDGKEF